MDIETTKIYGAAKDVVEQHYNAGTEKDLLARYIAEDISLAVVEVFGRTNDAKYLLDALANKVQSWCNPILDDENV